MGWGMAGEAIRGSYDVFRLLRGVARRADREHFYALHLDPRLRLLKRELVAIGTLTETLIHPREVFRSAIKRGTYALILAHTHPSGDPAPSAADVDATRQLCITADAVEIPVLLHVIMTGDAYTTLDPTTLTIPSWREREVVLTCRTTSPPFSRSRAPRSVREWESFIMRMNAPQIRAWFGPCDPEQSDLMAR
ncbi:MAG: JAB domain-containing protein [Nitrospirota bacterium]